MSVKKVEVFKTNVTHKGGAESIVKSLSWHFPRARINFDLEDCDNILRVESTEENLCVSEVIKLVEVVGFTCEPLPD